MVTSSYAFAEIEVPKMFIDSSITITLKNGKQYTFDGNKYMIVERKAKALAPVKTEVQEVEAKLEKSTVFVLMPESKLNRVRLIGGYGPNGFKTSTNNNNMKVQTDNSVLGGIGYDRMLNDKFSAGALMLSNGSLGLSIGLDF